MKKTDRELKRINKWLENNKLELNVRKTKYMLFKLKDDRQDSVKIKLHNTGCSAKSDCNCNVINRVVNCRYLGIEISENMKWQKQLEDMCNHLRYINFKLFYLRYKIGSDFMRVIYFAWVQSVLDYAIMFVGSAYDSALKRIRAIHRKILEKLDMRENYRLEKKGYNIDNILTSD